MTQAVTDEKFGAWVLKCNPNVWDLKAFLAGDGPEERVIDDWAVQDNYRSDRMSPEDPVVLWVTGAPDADLIPGVWGVGRVKDWKYEVVSVEDTGPDDRSPADVGEPGADDDLWLDESVALRAVFFIPVHLLLLDEPISRERVQETPDLADAEILRQPAMGNPSWLTKQQWGALQDLLGDAALRPPDPNDVARWKRDAQMQSPDAQTRRIIESVAVDHVWNFLEGDGWQVEDVHADSVGWDLTARRGGETRCVEVKGRGTLRPVVHLTSNEVRAAFEQPNWELAVVTGALRDPSLSWHGAQAVRAAAVPITYRTDLG